jgi:hypothetical protein
MIKKHIKMLFFAVRSPYLGGEWSSTNHSENEVFMSKNLFRIAADIPQDIRRVLLQEFTPAFQHVCCDTLTYAFRVTDEFEFPEGELACTVYGHVRTDDAQMLLVNVAGRDIRPDGQRFCLVHSLANPQWRSAALASPQLRAIVPHIARPLTFLAHFQRKPLRVLGPAPSRVAA